MTAEQEVKLVETLKQVLTPENFLQLLDTAQLQEFKPEQSAELLRLVLKNIKGKLTDEQKARIGRELEG